MKDLFGIIKEILSMIPEIAPAALIYSAMILILFAISICCIISGVKDIQDIAEVKRAIFRMNIAEHYGFKGYKAKLFGVDGVDYKWPVNKSVHRAPKVKAVLFIEKDPNNIWFQLITDRSNKDPIRVKRRDKPNKYRKIK